jgi:hypothetical protein
MDTDTDNEGLDPFIQDRQLKVGRKGKGCRNGKSFQNGNGKVNLYWKGLAWEHRQGLPEG